MTASDLLFEPGKDSRFNWDSYSELKKVDLKGQTLTIAGPWLGADKELAESVLAYFEAATGVDIQYAGSDSFEQQIVIDVQAGSPPDIAIFPQPGLAADLAAKGFLSPLDEQLGKWVEENYAAGSSWVDLGTFPDQQGQEQLFGFFYKIDLKSLVWFVPENFEDAGYEVPESMEELKTLTQQIVDDGETPWCIGVGSGGATGWPATDWVEDIMLRLFEPTVYDQWTTNAIPFNDDKVIEAIEDFGWFVKNDGFVDGGARAVAATDFRDSPKGLFSSPPRCYMHRQASFISSFFPEGSELGVDADFFYFPAYASKDLGKPVMGAGTLWSITNDTPAAREFIKFLQTPIAHEVWMAQSGFLTPFKSANVEAYGNDTLKKQGQILLDASTFRFDGSDLMPGKIGAGAFWTGMVDYTGGKSAKEVGDFIQSTWDTLK
ncbi:ABC transporter substrate-binding protein [Aliagarivorans marinus]|uniref:ABC transporter substrate-binding protein n=1 Tax=Aliagarivorans marinus TaxID=561965 RepID=UPI001FE0DA72|nr:ABC transporter substrate-binding protein [Aliagarivorans marinus]